MQRKPDRASSNPPAVAAAAAPAALRSSACRWPEFDYLASSPVCWCYMSALWTREVTVCIVIHTFLGWPKRHADRGAIAALQAAQHLQLASA